MWLPVALAAASVSVLFAVPAPGELRLAMLRRPPDAPASSAGRPAAMLLAAAAGWLAAGPVAAALTLAAMVALGRAAVRRRVAQERRRERDRALDALSLLAADLRAGRVPAEALAAAAAVAEGPSARALAAAAAGARLGGEVAGSLAAEGSAVPEMLRGLAACWTVCSSAGSGLAAGVERLEEGLRSAAAQRRLVEEELAGPRATAALLAALPLGGLALAGALGARPLQVLLESPLGLICLTAGVVLDGLGVAWTARLAATALPR